MDGKIVKDNLKYVNLDKQWLIGELKKLGVDDYKKVSLAELDTSGNLFFQENKE